MAWSLETYILSNTSKHRVNINGAYNPHHQLLIATMPATINAHATIGLLEKVKAARQNLTTIHHYANNAMYYRGRATLQFDGCSSLYKAPSNTLPKPTRAALKVHEDINTERQVLSVSKAV